MYQQIAGLFVSENTFADSYLLNGTNFFLQGILFIVPVYFIAPNFKIQTLKIFLILWILVVVFGDYYLYSTNRENIGIWNSLLRIIGASLAYINITLEHKDETIHLNDEINEETKQQKPINLTETERQILINQIKEKASKNPEYKKHVEKKLIEKKEQIEKESNRNTE